MDSIYHIKVSGIELSQYQDQYLLVVNIANRCGFHYQLEDLIEFDQKAGRTVIAFPSNSFHQHDEVCGIQKVPFFIGEEVKVNGEDAHPLFLYLQKSARGFFFQKRIMWNYTKFLIHPGGKKIERFSPLRSVGSILE